MGVAQAGAEPGGHRRGDREAQPTRGRLAAPADRAGQPRLLRARRAGDLGRRVRPAVPRAAGARGRRTRSCRSPTAPPSASAPRRSRARSPSTPTAARCSPWPTPSRPRSWRRGRSATPASSPSVRSAGLHHRDQDRRRRGEPDLRGRPARCRAPPAATASSARTSPPTSAPSPTCRWRSRARAGPALMEVRGEVYMPYESFERLNQERERGGRAALRQSRATPPRAGSASSIPTITRRRRLRMFAFAVEAIEGAARPSRPSTELLDAARGVGLPGGAAPRAAARRWPRCRRPIDDATRRCSRSFRSQADGVVVKVDRLALHERARRRGRPGAALGDRAEVRARGGGHPRSLDIRINVGRTGALNPVRRARAGGDRRRHGDRAPRCTTRS